jgi:hypothetical protein
MGCAMLGDFLRNKARELELLAEFCYDGQTAWRLRQIADELHTKAEKGDMPKRIPPFMLNRNNRGGGGIGRH